jgi:hypothetical protein
MTSAMSQSVLITSLTKASDALRLRGCGWRTGIFSDARIPPKDSADVSARAKPVN